MASSYKTEQVTFTPSSLANGECIPLVTVGDDDDSRPFAREDMNRVLDYNFEEAIEEAPETASHFICPPDAPLAHLEFELDDDATISDANLETPQFPKRYCCLRGAFIFYYDMAHVKMVPVGGMGVGGMGAPPYGNNDVRKEATFTAPPLGVVPLEKTVVEFPPGGRRVFREHAKTNARNGYELMIRHRVISIKTEEKSDDTTITKNKTEPAPISYRRRAPAYLVMDSLGQRDLWKKAIEVRANLSHKKDTKLRAAGTVGTVMDAHGHGHGSRRDASPLPAGGRRNRRNSTLSPGPRRDFSLERPLHHIPSSAIGGEISVLAGIIDETEQKDIDEALDAFGHTSEVTGTGVNINTFDEEDWVQNFFMNHDEKDAMETCAQLERWQTSIKKGLRGAVLEQYEYFVEASREMTIMGREVGSLKELVTKQVETMETMKNIHFDLNITTGGNGNSSGGGGHGGHGGHSRKSGVGADPLDDDANTYSSDEDESQREPGGIGGKLSRNGSRKQALSPSSFSTGSKSTAATEGTGVEVPPWLEDAVEEISAFVKECRYTDATDLLLKTKGEVAEIMQLNDRLTEKKLSKKQLSSIHRIQRSIEDLSTRLCERLSEGLRRKNEALKQISKKERAVDPSSSMGVGLTTPIVSPIALNDDAIALHLLVKLGRSQDAATAYSTRRSLLLNECLHERPICNTSTTNNVDVVIYAAQFSHSFFSCLATAVEGFLDLFSDLDKGGPGAGDDHSETSSINTSSLKTVPANALAATCLWCDSELSKFASAFGSKVLGNLSLSPRDGMSANSITDKITSFETTADITHLKNQLRAAEEMGEYAAAGKLRKKIAIQEQDERDGNVGHKVPAAKSSNDKERRGAIEIASKCIDQAFEFAMEFLNTIGLPLTPRLAEYLRTRLKGAEAEIAVELEDKWEHIIFDWKMSISNATYDAIRKSTSED